MDVRGFQVLALIVVHDNEVINYCYCYSLGGWFDEIEIDVYFFLNLSFQAWSKVIWIVKMCIFHISIVANSNCLAGFHCVRNHPSTWLWLLLHLNIWIKLTLIGINCRKHCLFIYCTFILSIYSLLFSFFPFYHQCHCDARKQWVGVWNAGIVGERPSAFDMIAIKQTTNETTGFQYIKYYC